MKPRRRGKKIAIFIIIVIIIGFVAGTYYIINSRNNQKDSLNKIANELSVQPSRWTNEQFDFIKYLVVKEKISVDFAAIPFKENLAKLVAVLVQEKDIDVKLNSATDVLRLAVALSGGDVSLKENTRFLKISRPTRRFILNIFLLKHYFNWLIQLFK